jgi:putative copper resistance protein D
MLIDPLIWLRAVHFTATVLTCGTICFVLLVADPVAAKLSEELSEKASLAYAGLRRRLRLMAGLALVVTVISGLAWLVWVASGIVGEPVAEPFSDGSLWQVIVVTRFGNIATLRLAVALLLGLSIVWSDTRRSSTRALSLAAAAVLVGLIAWTGHAGATPGAAGLLPLSADILHLVAAAAWLGGLPALASLLAFASHNAQVARLAIATIRRFSILGLISVAVLIVTGVLNCWQLLGGLRDLWTSEYGRLLALKVALFAAMLMLAAINRQRLTPRLPESGAVSALYRNSLIEFALGLGVLLLVAALGTMNPSAHMHMSSAATAQKSTIVYIHSFQTPADISRDAGQCPEVKAEAHLMRETI